MAWGDLVRAREPSPPQQAWSQYVITLPDDRPWRAATERLCASVHAVVHGADGAWWMVRKSPGVRVRVRARHDGDAIAALLDRAVVDGDAARWVRAPFEPEVARFGGEAATAAALAWLARDAAVWLEHERRGAQGRLAAPLLAAAMLDLAIEATCDDGAERDEVWSRIRVELGGCRADEPAGDVVPLAHLRTLANAFDRELLDRSAQASSVLARALRGAWSEGGLTRGLRAILTALASFHLNLWCIDVAVTRRMCRALGRGARP